MGLISVGQAVAAHGVKGEVKFWYYSDSGSGPLIYRRFIAYRDGEEVELFPARVRRQGPSFVIKFNGLETLESISFLLKRELYVREEDLPRLEEDEYYDYQLMGLDAVTEEGMVLGRVKDVMHTGASDILVIQGEKETLVPMTEDYVVAIRLADRIVEIRRAALLE
jgi:16S rRNA processing protein RimM